MTHQILLGVAALLTAIIGLADSAFLPRADGESSVGKPRSDAVLLSPTAVSPPTRSWRGGQRAEAHGVRGFAEVLEERVRHSSDVHLRLPMIGQSPVDVVLDQCRLVPGTGWYAWGKTLDGSARVTAGRSGQALSITVMSAGESFQVRQFASRPQNPNGTDRLILFREVAVQDHICLPAGDKPESEALSRIDGPIGPRGTGPAIVRRLYAYTDPIRVAAGDRDADGVPGTAADVEAALMDVTARLNGVFVDSGVTEVEIEYAVAWPSPIPDTQYPSLYDLSDDGDGVFDEVHALRDAYQADIGFYVMQGDTTAPAGSALQDVAAASRWWAINTGVAPILGSFIGSHETGHQFGCGHGRGAGGGAFSPPDPLVPYAWGYLVPNGYATVMAFGGSTPPRYSNPNILDPIQGLYPIGVDHDIDPVNSADSARAIRFSGMNYIQFYRNGQINLSDCNGNGQIDLLDIFFESSADCNQNNIPDECEILQDPTLDCNGDAVLDACQLEWPADRDFNGVLDSCEIAVDASLDCNSDGILDSVQDAWDYDLEASNSPPIAEAGQPGTIRMFYNVPEPGSDMEFWLDVSANYPGPESAEFVEVFVNGELRATLFEVNSGDPEDDWSDCEVNSAYFVIPFGSVDTPSVPDTLEVQLRSPNTTSAICPGGVASYANLRLVFSGIPDVDADRDGIVDCDDPSCSIADCALPFGVLDASDVSTFTGWYSASDDRADLAVPLGVWDFFDLDKFLAAYNQGCP